MGDEIIESLKKSPDSDLIEVLIQMSHPAANRCLEISVTEFTVSVLGIDGGKLHSCFQEKKWVAVFLLIRLCGLNNTNG